MSKFLFFTCFVFSGILFAQEFQPGQAKITAGVLIVRNIASQGGSEVTKLKRGDLIEVIEKSVQQSTIEEFTDFWYKVSLPKKKTGWVFGAYITFEVNLESGLRWKSLNPGPGQKFSGIAVSTAGEIMAGTESGTVFLSSDKGKTWRKLIPQALGTSIGRINKMLLLGKNVWIAAGGDAKGGLWKTSNNGSSWTQFTASQGLLSNEVYDVAVSSNAIFVATEKGVCFSKDEGATWSKFPPDDSLSGKILSITVTPDGKVFAGTENGLYAAIEKKGVFGGMKTAWERTGESSPNMGNAVNTVAVSPNGEIFSGTNRGLSKASFSALDKWSGIGGQAPVNSITIDTSGRVIVATDNGLNISLDKGVSWVTYKKENGLAGNKITQTAIHPTDKTIWITSGSDGLSYHE